MSESWNNIKCSSCNTDNWYYIGDADDLTLPDVDGTECYKCGHKEIIADWEDEEFLDYELGRENPTRG